MKKSFPLLFWLIVSLSLVVMAWWGFAFAPMPDISAEWVLRAREVCFGFMPNGLPASHGWILLIGAPLMMLTAILVMWGNEIPALRQALGGKNFLRVFVLLLILSFLAEAVWIGRKILVALTLPQSSSISIGTDESLENYALLDEPAPPFFLVDEKGREVSLETEKGKVIFLTFAYAHCRTMCPTLAHNVKQAAKSLGPQTASIYLITLDPWRDTPSSLPAILKGWELPASSHVLSGSPEKVTQVLDAYKIPRGRDEKTGEISHPALVYLVGANGRVNYVFNNASAKLLTAAGHRVLRNQSP